jgi:glycosyltransferase involved in cell wall biosynthesis/GT2 family glycosyltransferase
VHVAQLSFVLDLQGREPEQLLAAWPSLVDVAEAAARAGARVSVIQACLVTATIARAGIDYHFLPFGRASGAAPRGLEALLRALGPQVLHVHGLNFPRDVVDLARLAPGVPILLQDHASRAPRHPWRRRRWRRGFAAAAAVAFCSREQAQPFAAAGLIPSHVRVLQIPECPSRFTAGDQAEARRASGLYGDPCLLWVGHLDRNKDPLTVLSGVSAAVEQLPQLQLWCCFGSAPLLAEVEARVKGDPALRTRVHLLGRVAHERIEQLMRAADVFVLGSHREGSGYSLIEALACSLPPLVSDIPSFRALTDAGRVGALFPCGDGRQLAAGLIALAGRPRAALREAARAWFEQELSFEAVGRKLVAAYRGLLPWSAAAAAPPAEPGTAASPVVSVILPAFDRLPFLRLAVESVLAQHFTDWELIVADDGSGPATRDYLQQLHDPPRIRVLHLAHTGKPAAARNAALAQARGEYIALLDSDDVWLPDKLQLQIAALRAHPERAWSYTAFTLVDAAGIPLTGSLAKDCPAIAGPFLAPLLRGEPRIVQSAVIVRRELLERVGGYDEDLRVCEDYSLWIRLAQESEIGFIPSPLVLIRRHEAHHFGETTALAELGRMFARVQLRADVAELAPLLRVRRARAAASLAVAHAARHERVRALGALLSSSRYGWRHAAWWTGAAKTAVHALLPASVIQAARRLGGTARATDRAPL